MPDAHDAMLGERLAQQTAQETAPRSFSTPEFQAALNDAELLLLYAARNGQLPGPEDSAGTAAQAPVREIVEVREAAQAGRVTPEGAIAFWLAFAYLSRLTKPVTAASIRACADISLTTMKVASVFLVGVVILFSIFLFMSDSTAKETADLIDQQNAAAVKLWSDLQMLRPSKSPVLPSGGGFTSGEPQDGVAADRILAEIVEFSRKSSGLLQSASRLNYWFNPWWIRLSVKSVQFNKDNEANVDHLNVPPDLSTPSEIKAEGINQIKAYQLIRDYALGLYKSNTIIYGGISTYFLPTIYALLGAYLYGFRLYSRLIRKQEFHPSAAHSARYFIAAIAGLVVGLFGSLLPKSLSLPPLAVAFLVGYGVEAFFSRLDDLIARFKSTDPAAPKSPPLKAELGA